MRIVLVHSFPRVAEAISTQLEAIVGFRPYVISHKEAVFYLKEKQKDYDLILVNQNEKQIAEFVVCKEIYEMANCPIIALCFSNSCKEKIGKLFSILHKPLRKSKLIDCLVKMFPER